MLLQKSKELETSKKMQKQAEDRQAEMAKSYENLLKDRETFIKFLYLVFPSNILEEKLAQIPPMGQEGYGRYDYNYIYEIWTQH